MSPVVDGRLGQKAKVVGGSDKTSFSLILLLHEISS